MEVQLREKWGKWHHVLGGKYSRKLSTSRGKPNLHLSTLSVESIECFCVQCCSVAGLHPEAPIVNIKPTATYISTLLSFTLPGQIGARLLLFLTLL